MGIINTTPDSFSDGGRFADPGDAIKHGLTLVEEGADILDIGGESTRPGAAAVPLQVELDRVIPVIEGLRQRTDTALSIDTYKPEVMTAAIAAGVDMLNDVNSLRSEGALDVAASSDLPVCLMHMLGEPRTMQQSPEYDDVVKSVGDFFAARIEACGNAGIRQENLILDPGIGFGKTLQHNLQLLGGLPSLRDRLDCQWLIGVSRKSMIDAILDRPVDQRLAGSLGLAVQASLNGAKIIRVHDVQATHDALRCVEAVLAGQA